VFPEQRLVREEKSKLTTHSSDKGKPGESRGRKTMGLRLLFSYDRQVAEENSTFQSFPFSSLANSQATFFFSSAGRLERKTK
jgi:hypothetical protein